MKCNPGLLAVIVLYKVKLDESATFISLSKSLKENHVCLDLLVYDNSPEYNDELNPAANSEWKIMYKADPKNSGVSAAYNLGAEIAKKMEKRWMLLLDQDTNFPIQTVNEYTLAIEKYKDYKLFAPVMLTSGDKVISPGYFRFMRGSFSKHINTGINTFDRLSIINCGMCIDLMAFKQNNGYNELIRLDFSDHDFIKRFKKMSQINLL